MAKKTSRREKRKRAGSGRRDSQHRMGGDWTTLTLPDGVEIWKPKEGSHRIDIVPYEVGEGNRYADPGELYYERTFFAHRGIGPNNESYVCPAKELGKPCPICEYVGELSRDPEADQKQAGNLKAKERQLWLIHDHKEKDKGVQLWEFSHWNFGRLLDKRRKRAEEDELHISDFDDSDAGSTLKVDLDEEKGGGYSYLVASSIDFKPRRDGLDGELLDHGICLDALLKVESYAKLKSALFQTEEDEDQDEPEGNDEPATTAEDAGIKVGSKVGHDELGRCTVGRISGDGTSLTLEDENGEVYRPIGVDEVNLIEEKPEKKSTRKRKPAREEPEPEEDEPATTAEDAGIKRGAKVNHEDFGVCTVRGISRDGTLLNLEDGDGQGIHKAVGVDEVSVVEEKPEEKPAPKKKTTKKKTPKPKPEPEEDDWPDDDDDDWPEDGPAPPRKKTTEKKTAKPTPDPELEEDDDDWPDDDDD